VVILAGYFSFVRTNVRNLRRYLRTIFLAPWGGDLAWGSGRRAASRLFKL